jgi:hypothetical protein
MSKRELILRELDHIAESDLDKLLTFARALTEGHGNDAMPRIAAEGALAKDWLTAEEDSAWADL